MRSIPNEFYRSKEWMDCRMTYLKSIGGLCERCLAKDPPEYNAARIVHHKIYLKPENYLDPTISLCFDNLEALCQDCHNEEHIKKKTRYSIDEYGRVT